jgi:hypothetical protein
MAAMTISYYEDGKGDGRLPRRLLALMIANGCVAVVAVVAWTAASLFVAEPMSWATWVPISRGDSLDDLLEYPFVLLWLMPAAGAGAAWLAAKLRHRMAAYASVGLPLVLLGLVFGWYYLAPAAWH